MKPETLPIRAVTGALAAMAIALLFIVIPACDKPEPKPLPEEMTPIRPEPGEVHTDTLSEEKPATKVKFRRNKDGSYSWEISGEDVDEILKADRKLRRATVSESAVHETGEK